MTHERGVRAPLGVRPATDEDRRWAAQVMAGSDPWITLGRDFDRCLQICRDPEYLVFVAHEGERPLGFIVLQRRGVAGSPYIASVGVAADARGQGVGARLLSFAEAHFTGARHMFLCVSSFNPRARRFYERHGYTVIADLQGYVIPDASELLMHKRLARA